VFTPADHARLATAYASVQKHMQRMPVPDGMLCGQDDEAVKKRVKRAPNNNKQKTKRKRSSKQRTATAGTPTPPPSLNDGASGAILATDDA
jgi:hypothetical protein